MIRDIILYRTAITDRIDVPERGTEEAQVGVSFECVFVFLRLELGSDLFSKLGLGDAGRPEAHPKRKLLGDDFATGVFLREDNFILFDVRNTGVG